MGLPLYGYGTVPGADSVPVVESRAALAQLEKFNPEKSATALFALGAFGLSSGTVADRLVSDCDEVGCEGGGGNENTGTGGRGGGFEGCRGAWMGV